MGSDSDLQHYWCSCYQKLQQIDAHARLVDCFVMCTNEERVKVTKITVRCILI